MGSVAILHTGSEEDLSIVKHLEHCLEKSGHRKSVYQGRIKEGQAANDVYKNLGEYGKMNLPLIVVITKAFFMQIWLSTLKSSILYRITRYKNKSCVHVLAPSVDMTVLRRYSSTIANGVIKPHLNPYFRSVWFENLELLTIENAGNQLLTLLTSFPKWDIKSLNYCVPSSRKKAEDFDYETDLCTKADEKLPFESLSSASACNNSPNTLTFNERTPENILLSNKFNLHPRHMFELSKYLDRPGPYKKDYIDLAKQFDFTPEEIDIFSALSGRGEKPSYHLLQSIVSRFPDLTVKSFEDVLIDIGRADAVEYVKNNMYKR